MGIAPKVVEKLRHAAQIEGRKTSGRLSHVEYETSLVRALPFLAPVILEASSG